MEMSCFSWVFRHQSVFSSIKQIQGSKGSALFPAFDEAHNSSPNFLAADVKKANTSVVASNITEMRKDHGRTCQEKLKLDDLLKFKNSQFPSKKASKN